MSTVFILKSIHHFWRPVGVGFHTVVAFVCSAVWAALNPINLEINHPRLTREK
jgi:hypothetical protein